MNRDQMQQRRAESKYLISEETARAIRDFVHHRLELDRHSRGRPDFSYPVLSLYLDSDDLHSYWATVHGKDGRFKLRIRCYDDVPETPAFVEIKQRVNGHTLKQRCAVPRGELDSLLTSARPAEAAGGLDHPKGSSEFAALHHFLEKARHLNAKPKLRIAYRREAYVSADNNSVRLTLDRDVRAESTADLSLSTELRNPAPLCGEAVVLEVKCAAGSPAWMLEIIRKFGLRRRNFAKYVTGIGRQGLASATANVER